MQSASVLAGNVPPASAASQNQMEGGAEGAENEVQDLGWLQHTAEAASRAALAAGTNE